MSQIAAAWNPLKLLVQLCVVFELLQDEEAFCNGDCTLLKLSLFYMCPEYFYSLYNALLKHKFKDPSVENNLLIDGKREGKERLRLDREGMCWMICDGQL